MRIRKDDQYFTIAIYTVVTSLIIVTGTLALMHLDIVLEAVKRLIVVLYGLLKPLLFGIIIAYLLDPIVTFYSNRCHNVNFHNWLRKIKWGPKEKHPIKKERLPMQTWPTLLAFLTVVCVIWLFVLLIVMNVHEMVGSYSFDGLRQNISNYLAYFEDMLDGVNEFTEQIPALANKGRYVNEIYNYVNRFVIDFSNTLLSYVTDIGSSVMNIFLAIVVAFYLLQDKKRVLLFWNKFVQAITPHKAYHHVHTLGNDIDYVFSGYIRGQIIDAIIIAILSIVALTIIRIDFALIIGIVAGVFNLIPYFGPVVGFVLAGVVGLLDANPMKALYGIGVLFIIQQIDSWFINPKIVGECVRLHPVVVLLAVLIGGNLLGLVGMLIGVPVAAFIRLVLLRYMTEIFPDGEATLREEEALHEKETKKAKH